MLQAPPHQQLRRRTPIFRRQRYDGPMLHPQRPHERCVRLDDHVVRLAKGRDGCAGVEGVHFDLVCCGFVAWFGGQELLELLKVGLVSCQEDIDCGDVDIGRTTPKDPPSRQMKWKRKAS